MRKTIFNRVVSFALSLLMVVGSSTTAYASTISTEATYAVAYKVCDASQNTQGGYDYIVTTEWLAVLQTDEAQALISLTDGNIAIIPDDTSALAAYLSTNIPNGATYTSLQNGVATDVEPGYYLLVSDSEAKLVYATSELKDTDANPIEKNEASIVLPNTLLASSGGFVSETHQVFSSTTTNIAPGVTQSINYAYATADGKQMVYYIATADISRDDVMVQSSYKDAQCTSFGMAKLTEQMAAANAKYSKPENEGFISEYYTAVAGTNGDFYNMSTGQPSGAFVMNGVMSSTKANDCPWFAIFADGTALCGYNNTDWDAAVAAHGEAQQAVGGSQMLVYDGADVTASASGSYNTDRHSRTMVGVTADNKVVMAVLDGRQEPFSCGGTMHELAQIMLEQGCAIAINLDGGGSTTFAARQEGENEVTIVNRPSDGSERAISTGLIIASTAVPSSTFDHATLVAENEYVTPGSSVAISAKGVSPAGTAAEIPEGITYEATLGTVSADGVFSSDGTVGDAVVSMLYNGKIAGSVTIHVVIPDALSFDNSTITVPFGSTVELAMTATYGLNEVKMKPGDVTFALSAPIGTFDGFSFTAAESSDVTTSDISATFAGTDLSASATITLGKGSVVIYDFEDQDVSNFFRSAASNYNYVITPGECSVASTANGQVRSGNYSMRVECDFSTWLEGGYMNARVSLKDIIDLQGATRIGMWVYIPIEAASLNGRLFIREVTSRNEDGSIAEMADTFTTATQIDDGGNWNVGFNTQYDESGWHYIYADLPAGKDWCVSNTLMDLYINDRDGSSYGYNHLDYKSLNVDLKLYIDDITVDYSSAVDDREAPLFERVIWADATMSDAVSIIRGTVAQTTSSTISFGATVKENTSKSNYTGLDASTAKAYIDGVEVPCAITGGIMSVADVALADGIHTIKFTICDNMGNLATVVRQINVQANSGKSTVKLVPHDAMLNKILLGSLYYVDIVATDIEKVQSVSATLDLNDISVWELDHMEVTEGFEASYVINNNDENIATITITRTGDNDLVGEKVLVSMPIRTWQLPVQPQNGTGGDRIWMYDKYKKSNELLPIDVSVKVVRGECSFVDGSSDTFSGNKVQVDTESDAWFYNDTSARDDEYAAWNGGHDHRVETAQYYTEGATNVATPVALPDKAATCTEDGYTGRTFCEVCNSIADWGTTIPATGHSYDFDENGILKCTVCGDLFNGMYQGTEYVDGVAMDGWSGDSYYVDGAKLTGIQLIDGYYYDFGENGICEGKVRYTGFINENDKLYYAKFGVKSSGWVYEGEVYYYFSPETYEALDGKQYINGAWYEFENYIQIDGQWVTTADGYLEFYWAGQLQCNRWLTVKGKTYHFDKYCHAATGTYLVHESHLDDRWYVFDEFGVLQHAITDSGLWEYDGDLYYLDNGKATYAGLVKVGEAYYYFNSTYKAVSGRYWVAKTNGLMTEGYYDFGEDHKMLVEVTPEPETKNGLIYENGAYYYYVDGALNYAGLIEIDGYYYYINSTCKAVTGHYWVAKTNGLMAEGYYDFTEEGKMIIEVEPEAKNGLVYENGAYYYYVDGALNYAGLIEIDGYYYYINSTCKAVTGRYWVTKTNGLVAQGFYYFTEEGKMIIN